MLFRRKGLDEALESVREAIDFHVETLIEDGADIPATSSLTAHQVNPDYAGGVWAVVDVPVEKYLGPADKINITVLLWCCGRMMNMPTATAVPQRFYGRSGQGGDARLKAGGRTM